MTPSRPAFESAEVRRRRQRVVAVTTVAGATLLGRSLSTRPGSREFYTSTAAVATTWTLGSLLSGPLHLGRTRGRRRPPARPVLGPLATALGSFGVFFLGASVARRIPVLDDALADVLGYADAGDGRGVLATTLANGIAEELFFRGALYSALEDVHPVAASTGVYALTTASTRNPALVLAAVVMGAVFALQRRRYDGIQAPVITHTVWSWLMVRYLPPLFRSKRPRPAGRGR